MTKTKPLTVTPHLVLATLLSFTLPACTAPRDAVVLESDNVRIVFSDQEPGSLKIALEALAKDFENVMGVRPEIVGSMDADDTRPEIVVVNRASGATAVPTEHARELDGWESPRVYVDVDNNRT